ncbi:MAG: energy transducer TonB [Gammaproteobacteria bacterium]
MLFSEYISKLFSKGLTGPILVAVLFHAFFFISWPIQHLPLNETHEINITLIPLASVPQQVSQTESLSPASKLTKLSDAIKQELDVKPKLKIRTISEAFHTATEADYLTRWQSYIEQIGNSNYPPEALKRDIRGQLRLLVAINKDGSVREITLRQSSGVVLLDEAAIQIVKMAAPFEPLPDNLQDLDVLEIIRTWQFRGQLSTAG